MNTSAPQSETTFPCPECNGAGKVERGPVNRGPAVPFSITPQYVEEACDICGGVGCFTAESYYAQMAWVGIDDDEIEANVCDLLDGEQLVTICAWCERVGRIRRMSFFSEEWSDCESIEYTTRESRQHVVVALDGGIELHGRASHGMCPECFADFHARRRK